MVVQGQSLKSLQHPQPHHRFFLVRFFVTDIPYILYTDRLSFLSRSFPEYITIRASLLSFFGPSIFDEVERVLNIQVPIAFTFKMKQFLSTAAAFAAVVSFAHADLCANGHTNDDGNYYCQEVKGIVYTGVGGSGSYNKITAMGSNGVCSSTPHGYSGTLSPLDEEVSPST